MRQQGRDNAYAVTDPLSTLAAVDLEALEQLFAEGIHGFRHVIHGIEQIEGHDRLHDIELKQLLYPDAFSAASGESRIHTGWQEFPFSYAEACAAAAVTRFQQQSHLRFDELGTYRLFFYVSDQQLLRTMRDEQLQPLQHYDEAHHAHLLDTLRAYLFHGNSLQQTAALTFTHRNTVNYRMNKIREITGSDFSDSVVCFHYILAFYLDDYLNLHEATAKTT